MEHNTTILIVEDNAAQLQTLIDILEQEGFQPVGCTSGKAAIEACQHTTFSVAILDLRLPDMDGIDILKHLKQKIPEIKVIINTANATLETALEAINREAFAYIRKMGDVDELLGHIHRAFHAHLVGYSERLEQQVNARTAELSQANTALQQEIDVRKQTEERLHTALEEKKVLMQEILHRTKNNMTAIISLLAIQSGRVHDRQVIHHFEEISHRVQAMLLVQQQLYQSKDFRHLALNEYFEDLACTIFHNVNTNQGRIDIRFDLEPVMVSPDIAIPGGLLLNELLTNALKYAFPDGRSGEIRLSLHTIDGGQIELRVRDTGVGLPEGFDIRQATSLGLHLVSNFVKQIKGTLDINREHGTEWIIRFHKKR